MISSSNVLKETNKAGSSFDQILMVIPLPGDIKFVKSLDTSSVKPSRSKSSTLTNTKTVWSYARLESEREAKREEALKNIEEGVIKGTVVKIMPMAHSSISAA